MSTHPLAGKTALVTGSSQGIGRAIALKLASLGANVIINYRSSSTLADAVVSTINSSGTGHATAIQADVSSLAASKALIETTVATYGSLDTLVLNAGLLAQNGSLADTTEESFDRLYATNVKAPFFMAKEAAKHLCAAPGGGRLVFFSTSITHLSSVTPNYLLYASTKGAIEQMARVLAKDLGSRGVTVNTISPGPIATEAFFEGKSEGVVKGIEGVHPMGRIGRPEEVAEAVAWVVQPGSGWINGVNLRVNGGMTVG